MAITVTKPGFLHLHTVDDVQWLDHCPDTIDARYIFIDLPAHQHERGLIYHALKDDSARAAAVALAARGFVHYATVDGQARFVRDDLVHQVWTGVKDGEYAVSPTGVVYKVEPPADGEPTRRLLVVFSSMPTNFAGPTLARYFFRNYPSAFRYVPGDTAILRIADVGGVMGAYYMPTTHRPNNDQRVADTIRHVSQQHGVPMSQVLLIGTSKGGTAALYHGLTRRLPFIAVDPVLAENYYWHHHNDSHFTRGGVFPQTKDETFADLFARVGKAPVSVRGPLALAGALITSPNSPQFATVSAAGRALSGSVATFESSSPRIKDHPDVAEATTALLAGLITAFFNGWPIPPGRHAVS